MAEESNTQSPPYATFGSLLSLINQLRETTIPSRIDPSIFGSKSGSITYSVIAALKFLKLIDQSGVPSDTFKALVEADDENRKEIWRGVLKLGYPTLWDGSIDIEAATSGQFDEHIRERFGVKGSTVDKVAAFFISAAKAAEIPLSHHLKNRKSTSNNSSAKRNGRQKRNLGSEVAEDGRTKSKELERSPLDAGKALEYQLIDLMTEPDIDDNVKQSIWALVQYLTARKAQKTSSARGKEIGNSE